MTPETESQSKLNLLRANLKQYQESDLFTQLEKEELSAPILEQIEFTEKMEEAFSIGAEAGEKMKKDFVEFIKKSPA